MGQGKWARGLKKEYILELSDGQPADPFVPEDNLSRLWGSCSVQRKDSKVVLLPNHTTVLAPRASELWKSIIADTRNPSLPHS